MELLIDLFLLVAIFAAGYIYRDFKFLTDLHRIQTNLQKELNKTNNDLKELGVKEVKRLNHEIVNGIHYFYDEVDNSFVGQGSTLEEAAMHYSKLKGSDTLGWFTHSEMNKPYCFVNEKCMEFKNEN